MKPTRMPTSRRPVARWLWSYASAKTAVKSGVEALKIEASPESMYCWPHAIRKNGSGRVQEAEQGERPEQGP